MEESRKAFEAWFTRELCTGTPRSTIAKSVAWIAWQAAIKGEREACANVCEDRAGPQSMGAFRILTSAAAAIRERG